MLQFNQNPTLILSAPPHWVEQNLKKGSLRPFNLWQKEFNISSLNLSGKLSDEHNFIIETVKILIRYPKVNLVVFDQSDLGNYPFEILYTLLIENRQVIKPLILIRVNDFKSYTQKMDLGAKKKNLTKEAALLA